MRMRPVAYKHEHTSNACSTRLLCTAYSKAAQQQKEAHSF